MKRRMLLALLSGLLGLSSTITVLASPRTMPDGTVFDSEYYAQTNPDVAAACGFSESHFMRYFRKTMGASFVEYLKDYRLTMAARLLTTSDSTVLDVASAVGFDSLSWFNRAFKARYKMTPNQFRRTREQPPRR